MSALQRLALLLVLTLAGCAVRQPPPVVITDAPSPGEYSALRYYQWVQSASVDELKLEWNRLAQVNAQTATLVERVQLALLLDAPTLDRDTFATSDPAERNDAQYSAEALLHSLHIDDTARRLYGDYAMFAEWWRTLLEQRASLSELTAMAATLKRQVATLREENVRLQEQIEALTTIERELMEQEQSKLE